MSPRLKSRCKPHADVNHSDALVTSSVDNLSGTSKKKELANIQQHLKSDGALLIFPAGEVSRLSPTGIKDCKWNTGFLRMAKANAPILPIYIKRKTALFYGTSMIYKPLASLLLVKEMFNSDKNH